MRLLLDTHTFLWRVQAVPALSAKAHAAIANPEKLPWFLPIISFEDTD